MKKVLCLIDSLASGGAQRQIVGLAALLRQKGYDVKLITYYDIPFYLPLLIEGGVEYENIHVGTGLFARLFRINRAIRYFDPDVVISYLDTPSILACILKLFRPRWKLIVSERNTTQTLTKRDRIKFFLYKFADAIVANSYSQEEFIKVNYATLSPKCSVITNFVDTDTFRQAEVNADNEVLQVIGVGRISKQKNIPMLIEAVKNVDEQGKKIRVDWYGAKFDTYNECMQMIKQYGLEDTFVFHEPCSNIFEKYQESDLFILPSIYEGFPNVLCEAMSCGLPIIATDVCDNSRIVRHEENGYLIPSGDSTQLTARLLQFMELPFHTRKAMGEKSRIIAVDLFSKETFIKKYTKLIE